MAGPTRHKVGYTTSEISTVLTLSAQGMSAWHIGLHLDMPLARVCTILTTALTREQHLIKLRVMP